MNADRSSLEAVTVATAVLENSELTNAGYGSNLTIDGYVECDASVMDGRNMCFGAVGAVTRIKNPVCLAEKICCNQNKEMTLGRIPPWYAFCLPFFMLHFPGNNFKEYLVVLQYPCGKRS